MSSGNSAQGPSVLENVSILTKLTFIDLYKAIYILFRTTLPIRASWCQYLRLHMGTDI